MLKCRCVSAFLGASLGVSCRKGEFATTWSRYGLGRGMVHCEGRVRTKARAESDSIEPIGWRASGRVGTPGIVLRRECCCETKPESAKRPKDDEGKRVADDPLPAVSSAYYMRAT